MLQEPPENSELPEGMNDNENLETFENDENRIYFSCNVSCRLKCSKNINSHECQFINGEYRNLANLKKKRDFILTHVEQQAVARRTCNNETRNYSRKYF